MASDERHRRVALNEALFREVNERLGDINDTLSSVTGVMVIICECGDLACTQQLTIPETNYEHLRSDPTWFAIVPGHGVATVEVIVSRHDGYDIVQKREGTAAAHAEATDPRA